MSKKKFSILYKILDIFDYSNSIIFKNNENNPLIDNCNNFIENKIEGYSRINRIRLRIINKSDETYIQLYLNKKLFEFEIEENFSLKPITINFECKVFDESYNEFIYPLVFSLIPDYEKTKNSWYDIGDNIENIICEINCYDVIFKDEDENENENEYIIKSSFGIDKNLVPKKKNTKYGFILYGNNYSELYFWCIIKKKKNKFNS